MPFSQRDRSPFDVQREADRDYESNLILYAMLLIVVVVIILCCTMLLTVEQAAAAPERPELHNTCEQAASWAEWDALLLKHPDNDAFRRLYELRVELCAQVKAGELTVAEGTARFEQARQALMERAKRPRAEIQSKD
jgi:hypothetical protein